MQQPPLERKDDCQHSWISTDLWWFCSAIGDMWFSRKIIVSTENFFKTGKFLSSSWKIFVWCQRCIPTMDVNLYSFFAFGGIEKDLIYCLWLTVKGGLKKNFILLGKVLITLVLFYFVSLKINFQSLQSLVSHINPFWFLLSVVNFYP